MSASDTESVETTVEAAVACGFSIADGYYKPSGQPNIYRLSGSLTSSAPA
jgi:hypothetical protein